jgi:hypothetical protein
MPSLSEPWDAITKIGAILGFLAFAMEMLWVRRRTREENNYVDYKLGESYSEYTYDLTGWGRPLLIFIRAAIKKLAFPIPKDCDVIEVSYQSPDTDTAHEVDLDSYEVAVRFWSSLRTRKCKRIVKLRKRFIREKRPESLRMAFRRQVNQEDLISNLIGTDAPVTVQQAENGQRLTYEFNNYWDRIARLVEVELQLPPRNKRICIAGLGLRDELGNEIKSQIADITHVREIPQDIYQRPGEGIRRGRHRLIWRIPYLPRGTTRATIDYDWSS